MKYPRIKAVVFLVIVLFLGYYIAQQINGFLGISFNPKTLPDVPEQQAAMPEPLEPIGAFDAIVLPENTSQDELYQRAAEALASSLALRSGSHPDIISAAASAPTGRVITVAADDNSEAPEAFTVQLNGAVVAITGGSRLGAAYGLYYLADALSAGEEELFGTEQTIAPVLPYRFVDIGSVGVTPDEDAWRAHDYSHHSRAFEDVILATAPYVDETNFHRVEAEFKEYVHRMIAYGNNGLVIKGFLEYVNFDYVGDGFEVYGPESEYRQRHEVLRQKFGELFAYAHQMGMDVILLTDMVALTEPLENYFDSRFGGIDVADPELWEVYRLGLEELFDQLPVDGVMIRIGEAGAVYNLEGWNYYSALHVKTDEAVRTMLREFLQVAETRDKTIIFRTWSVGIGEVGDVHTNPETYARVLSGLNSPNLVLSTKFVMGDFDSYLPLNPTLMSGEHQRIIEFQARREFEAFSAFPNYLGPLHQTALQEFRARNPNIAGTWLWTQDGGPWRAGPMSLYPFHGFWLPIDANVYATSRLAWEPDLDLTRLTETWVSKSISQDPQTIANLTEMMLLSREAVLKGFYIGEFARQQVLALGLEPPPMMWIFKWDIVSGSNSALSPIYFTSRDNINGAVTEGFEAVDAVRQMKALLAEIDPATLVHPEVYEKLVESLDYEENLFDTLAWYRQTFLYYYRWLDRGDPGSYQEWQSAYEQFEARKQEHLTKYGANLDFPAYNFFAADAGMAHAERSRVMLWIARILLALIAAALLSGSKFVQTRTPSFPGKAGLRALWLALTAPWNLGQVKQNSSADLLIVSLLPLSLVVVGRLAFSAFLSTTYGILVFLSLGGFVAVLLLLYRDQPRFHLWAGISAPLLLKVALLMGVLAIRGPLYYWYQFWTNPNFCSFYITLSVAANAWVLFTLYMMAKTVYGRSTLTAAGSPLVALGVPMIVIGAITELVGLEKSVTGFNNEMAILPLGLSKILGITIHLDIPTSLPLYMMVLGAVLAGFGWITHKTSRSEG